MVMDRCKRRRNRLKSALGRRRVSQSEDLLRCRISLSHTVYVPHGYSLSHTVTHSDHPAQRESIHPKKDPNALPHTFSGAFRPG
jgi:hypothetical protein